MRTTVTLDNDVYQAINSVAQASGQSLGKVLSEAARRGLQPRSMKTGKKRRPTFPVSPNAPLVSARQIQKVWEEEGIG